MRLSYAIIASVAIHAILAAGIAAYLEWSDDAVVTAKLDLSSVELSFAEDDSETAPASQVVPMPPPEELQTPEPPEESVPETELTPPEKPLPPEVESVRLPEPAPEKTPKFDPVEVKDPEPPPPERPPVPEVAPKSAKIDAPPSPKRSIRPDYPKGARQRGEQGNVTLEIRVNESGAVDGVVVVESCGFKALDDAAVAAARKAKFVPAKSGRSPVASTARLTLEFKLTR